MGAPNSVEELAYFNFASGSLMVQPALGSGRDHLLNRGGAGKRVMSNR